MHKTLATEMEVKGLPPFYVKEIMIEKIREILNGIDKDISQDNDGWWETSTGAEFGAKKLKEIETVVNDDNIEKMACEYTDSESECQAFILACQVMAEGIVKLISASNFSQQRELFKSFLEKVVEETEVGDLTWQTRDEAKELLKLFKGN